MPYEWVHDPDFPDVNPVTGDERETTDGSDAPSEPTAAEIAAALVAQYPHSPIARQAFTWLEGLDAEVARLRQWQDEASAVWQEWDRCYDLLKSAGYPAPLGRSRAEHVRRWMERTLRVGDDVPPVQVEP